MKLIARQLAAVVLVAIFGLVSGQSTEDMCHTSAGVILATIFGTLFVAAILLSLIWLAWTYYVRAREGEHLILETDPEKGDKYAFDNPCFKDKNDSLDPSKTKWIQWSPLGLVRNKQKPTQVMDDTFTENAKEVNVVSLKSHDFTGLGFNVFGNMRDGIYVRDVLQRGPAFESGKVKPGDRVMSVKVAFKNIVYEDALHILSYASPYEVELELETPTKGLNRENLFLNRNNVLHPAYKSCSSSDLSKVTPAFLDQKLEADVSKPLTTKTYYENEISPVCKPERNKKVKVTIAPKPEIIEVSIDTSKIIENNQIQKREIPDSIGGQSMEKTENKMVMESEKNLDNYEIDQDKPNEITPKKMHKFGVKVFPDMDVSGVQNEKFQNENNVNYEKQAIDEVDNVPIENKDDKKMEAMTNSKVDDEIQRQKKLKSKPKAPEPPVRKTNLSKDEKSEPEKTEKFERVERTNEERAEQKIRRKSPTIEVAMRSMVTDDLKISDKIITGSYDYSSDSDADTDKNSVINNTIELNASDITIHQSSNNSENDSDSDERKAASLGDLSRFEKTNTKTIEKITVLERAQSLDVMETPTCKKRKADNDDDDVFDSNEMLYSSSGKCKEPRLSLAMDKNLSFKTNSLKKSTDWGNLADAIPENKTKKDDRNGFYDLKNDKIVDDYKIVKFEKIDTLDPICSSGNVDFNGESKNIDEIKQDINRICDKLDSEIESDLKLNDMKLNDLKLNDLNDSNLNDLKLNDFKLNDLKLPTLNNDTFTVDKKFLTLTLEDEIFDEKPPLIPDDIDMELDEIENNNVGAESTEEDSIITTLNKIERQKLALDLKSNDLKFDRPSPSTYDPWMKSDSMIVTNQTNTPDDRLNEVTKMYSPTKLYDTNVSDDIKVSRHIESRLDDLDHPEIPIESDDGKTARMVKTVKSNVGGVSNVTITTNYLNGDVNANLKAFENFQNQVTKLDRKPSNGISFQTSMDNNDDELYMTSIETSLDMNVDGSSPNDSNDGNFVTEIRVKNVQKSGTVDENQKITASTTSTTTPRVLEKRSKSQIELIRSNFEKSPSSLSLSFVNVNRPSLTSPIKSKIPIKLKSPENRMHRSTHDLGDSDEYDSSLKRNSIGSIGSTKFNSTSKLNQFKSRLSEGNLPVTDLEKVRGEIMKDDDSIKRNGPGPNGKPPRVGLKKPKSLEFDDDLSLSMNSIKNIKPSGIKPPLIKAKSVETSILTTESSPSYEPNGEVVSSISNNRRPSPTVPLKPSGLRNPTVKQSKNITITSIKSSSRNPSGQLPSISVKHSVINRKNGDDTNDSFEQWVYNANEGKTFERKKE